MTDNIMNHNIETARLTLIPCKEEILQEAIKSSEALAKLLKINIAENWTQFGVHAFQFSLEKILKDEGELSWLTYFPVTKEENMLIGSCGYKGKPGKEAIVEIGYEVAPLYRDRGLATEIAQGLIDHAF